MFLPQTVFARAGKKANPPKLAEWVVIAQNQGGIYSYDKKSLVYFPDAARVKDVTEIKVTAKADLLDKNFQQQLQKKYGKKLKNGDRVEQCILDLVLHKADKTYKLENIKLFSTSGQELVKKDLQGKFQPIPAKTFVAVLLDETIKLAEPTETKIKPREKGETNANTGISENKTIPKQ